MSGTSKWLSRAIAIAVEAHANQVDKAEEPYIHHPLRVMELVRLAGGSTQAQVVAVLHDVIEDCPEWDRMRIAQRLFPEAIGAERDSEFIGETLDMIEAIAHREDETYLEYVTRVSGDATLALVKWGDTTHNWARLGGLGPEKRLSLSKRYERNFGILGETAQQTALRSLLLQEFLAA